MGFFSWKCKGCTEELCEGEKVRLNGCKGKYDGYGSAGGYDYGETGGENPIAWHEACYQKATDKQKLDETPSKDAPNQGCGIPHLEFLPKFSPENKTKFSVQVSIYDGEYSGTGKDFKIHVESHMPILVITDNGIEDQRQWDKDRNAAEVALDKEEYGTPEYKAASALADKYDYPHAPVNRPKYFDALKDALKAAQEITDNCNEFCLDVIGKQGDVEGLVYRRNQEISKDPMFKYQTIYYAAKFLDYDESNDWIRARIRPL
jgi:hypothetical protein